MRRSKQILFVTPPQYGYQSGYIYAKPRQYGLSNFIGDLVMTGLTGGFWIIWIIIREICR